MSTASEPTYVGVNGLVLETILNKSLTGASAVNYTALKPKSGDILTWACSIDDVPTGTVSYKSSSSEINEVGFFKLQAFITYPSGDIFPCDPTYFEVREIHAIA